MATVVSLVAWPVVVSAQLPVCPQPEPDQPVYFSCASAGRFAAVRLLTDLAIDHLLRGDNGPILREPAAVFASAVGSEAAEENEELVDVLRQLEPLRLTRIDTSSGTLRLDVEETERSLDTRFRRGDAVAKLTIDLPPRIEGGYWRTPGVLQMVFWKGQRPRFEVSSEAGTSLAAEVECLVASADGIRLVTAGSSIPDVVVGFGPCE